MRGHRVKLKYESPNKEIYKGDYSGEELEYSYYMFDVIANKWINIRTTKPTIDFCGCQWTSTGHSSYYNKDEYFEYRYTRMPKNAPKGIRAFRRFLRKYSKYNLLPKGTKVTLNSWNNGKDIYGFIK